jgi:hypothetical protein
MAVMLDWLAIIFKVLNIPTVQREKEGDPLV